MILRLHRLLWPILLPMLLSGCVQAALFRVVNTGGGSVPPVETRTYAPDRDLKLDIYRPASNAAAPQNAPVAIFFYGGSWREGNRSEYAFVGKALASQGIVTLVVDYRLYPRAAFPAFMVDAASAARWARDNVAQFGGDPKRMYLVGHSAGGQIAALLATDAHYLAAEGMRPREFAGVVGIAGPYDFLPLTDPKLVEVFGPESEWSKSQPVTFVDGDEPPFLLLQGLSDRVVAPKNADSLERKLRSFNEPVTHITYTGVGHIRILLGFRFTSFAPTLRDTAAFINQKK